MRKVTEQVGWFSMQSWVSGGAGSNVWRATRFTEWDDLIMALTSLLRWWVRMSEVKGGREGHKCVKDQVAFFFFFWLVKQHSAFSPLWELSASQNELFPSLSPFRGSHVWGARNVVPGLPVSHARSRAPTKCSDCRAGICSNSVGKGDKEKELIQHLIRLN